MRSVFTPVTNKTRAGKYGKDIYFYCTKKGLKTIRSLHVQHFAWTAITCKVCGQEVKKENCFYFKETRD